jgi:hypothetical protein
MSTTQSALFCTFRLCSMSDHRVALVNQFVQHVKQLRDVVEMKAGGSQARQGEGQMGSG